MMSIAIVESKPLGKGYFGTVYQGFDSNLNRDVAVKFFDMTEDRYVEDMRKHVESLLSINHPNVLQIYQISEVEKPESDGAENAIIMEFVDGMTLKEWKLGSPYDLDLCKSLSTQLIDGVAAFHEAGSPHGDLHSNNVLVDGSALKIIDPYCVGSSVIFSTSGQTERVKYDVRHLCNLICEILSSSDNREISKRFSMFYADDVSSVEDVRLRIESVFCESPEESSSQYEHAQQIFSGTKPRSKAALISRTIDVVRSGVDLWRGQNISVRLTKDNYPLVNRDFMNHFESSLSVLLAGCVSGGSDASHLRIIKALCRKGYGSGFSQLPLAATAGWIRMAGAAALVSGNDSQILDLITRKTRYPNIKPATIFDISDLSGWPSGLGGNCKTAWIFWLEAYNWSSVLQEVFVTKTEYYASMFGFSMFASFAAISDDLKRDVDPKTIRPSFAPIQMSVLRDDMDDVWDEFMDIMERFENKKHLATYLLNIEEHELEKYWEYYRLFYVGYLSSIDDWYRDAPIILSENPFG